MSIILQQLSSHDQDEGDNEALCLLHGRSHVISLTRTVGTGGPYCNDWAGFPIRVGLLL
jgi:hypothetical protein